MARKGALTKDPKNNNKKTSSVPTRAENRAIFDTLSPAQQAEYSRIRASQGGQKALEFLKGAGQQSVATTTPVGVTEQGFMGAGQAYQDMLQRFGGEQYQPQFEQEMERARQNVMNQFERRNNQAFAQQRQDFETTMANKGVAPGSQQYQLELKSLNDRQDMARQEAMGAAEQAAYSVQNQQFGQAGQLAMRPYEQWNVLQQPYATGITSQYQMQAGAQAQEYAKELAALENKYKLQQIRATPRGGGGGAQIDPYTQMEIDSLRTGYPGKQPNPNAQFVTGVVQGGGQQIINRTNK
jgi:hypothetical protein